MRRRIAAIPNLLTIACLCASLGAIPGAGAAFSENSPADASPPNGSGLEIMQFIAAGRLPPQDVIDLDNNAEILTACRQGCSLVGLGQAGVEATASQLQLLHVMHLLSREEADHWRTNFPILGTGRSAELRRHADSLAREAFSELQPQFNSLREALDAGGIASHGYAVYFSYVLDGMVWGFFEEYGKVPKRRLSGARPFWSGEIWTLDTPRASWTGTAAISDSDLTLKIVLSRFFEEAAVPLLRGRTVIERAFEEYLQQGRVVDAEAMELLGRYGIVDRQGAWTVPVIDETGRDQVFLAAETLTSDLVDWILARVDSAALREQYGLRSDPQTLVIVYHELMWSLMSILEEQKLVERPGALDEAAAREGHEADQLIILVDRASRANLDDLDEDVVESEKVREDS